MRFDSGLAALLDGGLSRLDVLFSRVDRSLSRTQSTLARERLMVRRVWSLGCLQHRSGCAMRYKSRVGTSTCISWSNRCISVEARSLLGSGYAQMATRERLVQTVGS